MERKKSLRANLETKRGMFFQAGLVLALGVVLAAFSWQKAVQTERLTVAETFIPVETVSIPPTVQQPPLQPPPPMPSLNLVLVDNDLNIKSIDFGSVDDIGDSLDWQPPQITVGSLIEDEEPIPPINMDDPIDTRPFMAHVRATMHYPEVAIQNAVKGKVIVQFVIDKQGKLGDAKVVRSVDPLLDAEALRLVNSSPRWKPVTQGGRPVKVRFTFPIVFSLQEY